MGKGRAGMISLWAFLRRRLGRPAQGPDPAARHGAGLPARRPRKPPRAGGFWRSEQGVSLLETVAALGLMAAAIMAAVSVLTTHSIGTRSSDSNDVAINLVKTQLEDIKNATYNTANCYPLTVTPPSGYTVTILVVLPYPSSPGGSNLQLVTVTATRSGTTYLSVQMYKANLSGTTVTQTC